jgi:hypothetical protein
VPWTRCWVLSQNLYVRSRLAPRSPHILQMGIYFVGNT